MLACCTATRSRGPVTTRLYHRDVAVPRPTLPGFPCLSERFDRRSDGYWFTAPSTPFSRPRGVPPTDMARGPEGSRMAPAGFGALSGFRLRCRPRPEGRCFPSWGSTPLQRRGQRSPLHPGLPHPARSVLAVSRRLDGLLLPWPRGLARSAAARGVSTRTSPFGRMGRDALPRPLHPFVRGASHPRNPKTSRSNAPLPPRHLSPPALVPWPRSQDSRDSSSKHVIPGPSRRREPPTSPLTRFHPRRLGEPSRVGPAPQGLVQSGNQQVYWRPTAPLGFHCTVETFWRLPAYYSAWHRHAWRSRRFSGG
jgi:hypothetical protein